MEYGNNSKSKSANAQVTAEEFKLPDLDLTSSDIEANSTFDISTELGTKFLQGAASNTSITLEQKAALNIMEAIINKMATDSAAAVANNVATSAQVAGTSALSTAAGTVSG